MSYNHIAIYQFCRAFNNIHYSERHKRYVSGGFAHDQITHWNKEVPQEIRQYPTFESCYRNANEYQKNIIISIFMPDQTDITVENKLKQKGKAIQFIDEIPKRDESEFKVRVTKLQECQKRKAIEFDNCLDNKKYEFNN
ncbi:hypothetical protein NSTC745_01480 [Nostoc sp. DSM 114161]|jgi:hypothetical protein|uniref:hypothetical protein n=1 Tax=Nostoc sp. DSM 114161 TaxID=3440143 RepID=UPI004045B268